MVELDVAEYLLHCEVRLLRRVRARSLRTLHGHGLLWEVHIRLYGKGGQRRTTGRAPVANIGGIWPLSHRSCA